MVISSHFLCKDLVHHPIDSQPFINGWPSGLRGICQFPGVFSIDTSVGQKFHILIHRKHQETSVNLSDTEVNLSDRILAKINSEKRLKAPGEV